MKKVRLLLLTGLLLCIQFLYAQNRTITGKITDNERRPLAQVSVTVPGTAFGTTTNVEGNFTLQVPANARLLEISSVGYATQQLSIPSQGTLNVTLAPGSSSLDEVVVTGYTRERRSAFTGAVAKVEAKEVNQVPMASIDQILQGRAPGMYVTAGSGQPGAAATVVIRGIGSINGATAPLYVIDGVPVSTGVFAALSPSDIESVDVLKDASATSLYGSRGSNGVIVITTKRGKSNNKVSFGFKSQYGIANRTREKFEMMNATQRLQFEEEIGVENGNTIGPGWTYSPKNPNKIIAGGAIVPKTPADFVRGNQILDSLRAIEVDWRDILFRQGNFQEYEVNASGGSEKISFYSAFNYFQQKGIAIRSDLRRFSLRNNVDFKSSRFTAALSTTLNFAKTNFIESENTTAVTNPFASVYYALPYEQPYVNGELAFPGAAKGNTTAFNGIFNFTPGTKKYYVLDQREGTSALERLLATTQKREEIKAILGANFRFKITDNLALISTLGMDYREFVAERYIDPNTQTGTLVTGANGSFSEGYNRFYRLFGNGGINFTKRFGTDHNVDVSALYEGISTRARNFNYVGFGINRLLLNTPAGITQGTATNGFIPTAGGGRDFTGLQSFIGIGRYIFKEKYSFNASYRIDGSSTVPETNRWHSFYSAGATWNISRETFMDGVNFVSDLKLRASYGETASPFNNSFDYLSTYGNARYDGVTGIAPATFGNEFYDWEYNKQTNIGIDFALLKRKIRASIDLYNKKTENLFINQQVSRTSGVGALNINAGTLRNRGIELDLTADLISNSSFRLSVGGNAAYNENEITDLGQVNEFILGTSIIRVGLPFGQHYIPRWAGVDASTGEPLYYNRDGSVTKTYDRANQSVAEFGSWLPKVQGGFNGSLNYKGIYLEAFFSFAAGNKRFNNEDFFNENTTFATSNQSTRFLQRWRKPGDATDIQKYGTARQFSSKDIQDASYVRFRNVNIGYTVPARVLQRITNKISSATIFAQGQNLYTWTTWRGFDPEDNNNISTFEYPGNRVITFGINLAF